MNAITNLMTALDERTIARTVAMIHDQARLDFRLSRNTVNSFDEFTEGIGGYFNYHFSRCMAGGGRLSDTEARGRAKELLEREYRRRNGDIVMAYNDAHDGTNGGMRAVLDLIADGLKEEAIGRYVREVFDREVTPNSWDDKVMIIRQFIERFGSELATSIRRDQPERYAQNYRMLIESYVEGLRRTSSMFRSL